MERRRTFRRAPAPEEPLSHVRFRTGRDASVVNVSDWGLLVEGIARLLPGTHIDVHVVTKDGRVLVRSRVTRACVCNLTADVIRYRGALAFERAVDTSVIRYVVPAVLAETAGNLGSDYPEEQREPLIAMSDRSIA